MLQYFLGGQGAGGTVSFLLFFDLIFFFGWLSLKLETTLYRNVGVELTILYSNVKSSAISYLVVVELTTL